PNAQPTVAPWVTRNSAAETVPTMRRGLSRPAAISVEVVTGPHPPPPVASTMPPTEPRATKKGVACGRLVMVRLIFPRLKRQIRLIAISTNSAEVTGWAASSERFDNKVAPINAAMAPGMAREKTIFQSTLPNRQWLNPDTNVE